MTNSLSPFPFPTTSGTRPARRGFSTKCSSGRASWTIPTPSLFHCSASTSRTLESCHLLWLSFSPEHFFCFAHSIKTETTKISSHGWKLSSAHSTVFKHFWEGSCFQCFSINHCPSTPLNPPGLSPLFWSLISFRCCSPLASAEFSFWNSQAIPWKQGCL